ncbi:MAG TPA: DinB family protein [Gemmatimonadales bacterium]|nr:DinB family protein [Gemmatimonadales bacterium]
MNYSHSYIPESDIPRTTPIFQHLVDTYASETNKLASVWSELRDHQLEFRPHTRSSSIRQILVHQILSERRFFAEFLGLAEPEPDVLLPPGSQPSVTAYVERVVGLARSRLVPLAAGDERFWLTEVPFFDVRRQRIWVFWRRVLHTAHHRAQVGVCLRLLEDRVPATYGPTADVTWSGADPTTTLDAARRAQP